MKNIGIYIHIPFCERKCYYCDFISYANKTNMIEKYITALLNEIIFYSKYKNVYKINTVYIGGGTPSYIHSNYILKILETIKNNFYINKNAEITIEINPGTVDREKLKDYFDAGINRLSIGLQSIDDRMLKLIGRIHNYSEFLYTYNLAKKVGFKNINVDLIIGLPTQTLKDVEIAIREIIKLNAEHISVYSLILEEGTILYKKVKEKELYLPNEILERKMYWKIKKELGKHGFIHYEISNFAKLGYESKHNMSYWNQEEYLGFGVAAHSYINDLRYSNTKNLKEYIENVAKDISKIKTIHEIQTKEDKMNEYMILGLRKIQGIKISEFENKFVENPIYLYRELLSKLVMQQLIEVDGNIIKLTNRGIDLANLVWEEFV